MIQILNKRASTHPNWCEDNYFLYEDERFIVGAVLDGCSTGINSHFASTAVKYAFERAMTDNRNLDQLSKINYQVSYSDFFSEIIGDVKSNLTMIKMVLNLTEMNLLSTIVFFTFNKLNSELYVKFIGDGSVFVNGTRFDNDENNMPDYLAYHLENISWSTFYKWSSDKPSILFTDVNSFAICTDGIDSFSNVHDRLKSKTIPVSFLIDDSKFSKLTAGLEKKFNILTNRFEEIKFSDDIFCWEILDDLTIIKYNQDEVIQ